MIQDKDVTSSLNVTPSAWLLIGARRLKGGAEAFNIF